MPGLSWSATPSSTGSSSTSASACVETAQYCLNNSSLFTRATSASSIGSQSPKTSVDSSSPRKGSLKERNNTSPATLTSTLFSPLRLVESPPDLPPAPINEDPSSLLPSICTSIASLIGPVLPSTPTLVTSPKSSIFSSSLDSSHASNSRRQSTSSTFSLPRSPIKVHRRHHCRRCGASFCDAHSSHTATLSLANEDITLSTIDEVARIEQDCQESPSESTAFTSADTLPLPSPLQYIRARVCDKCYNTLQRARSRLQDSPPQPAFNSLVSGWSTPTIMEDDDEEEFFDSMERIRRESKREQCEALKVLCNDFTANRIVAKAAGIKSTAETTRQHPSLVLDCGQALRSDVELAMRGQLATSTLWEKAELKKKHEEIAKRAMSIDSLTIEECDSDFDIDLEAVVSLSKQSIYDRRCSTRPPSPQPIPDVVRRGSADTTNSIHSTTHDSSMTPSTSPVNGTSRMGANRLQRSYDSCQRTDKPRPAYFSRRASRPTGK
jgi:hypothetical protein